MINIIIITYHLMANETLNEPQQRNLIELMYLLETNNALYSPLFRENVVSL